MTRTAQDFRDEATAAHQRAADSFHRSDTDGFVSQWADGLMGQLARRKAEITEAGGVAEFTGLYEGDRRVAAKTFTRTFNGHRVKSWVLRDDETDLIARRGKKFIPFGEASRIQKNLGLSERRETAPAWADLDGRGTGLSGTAWVSTFRTGDKWGLDAEQVTGGAA
jgi:hypothetical protein